MSESHTIRLGHIYMTLFSIIKKERKQRKEEEEMEPSLGMTVSDSRLTQSQLWRPTSKLRG